MSERPILSKELEYDTFLQYYYLKEELVAFCKEDGLSAAGGKQDITKRIEHYLKTGENLVEPVVKRKHINTNFNELSLDSIIEENFICSEMHRAFFKAAIASSLIVYHYHITSYFIYLML